MSKKLKKEFWEIEEEFNKEILRNLDETKTPWHFLN